MVTDLRALNKYVRRPRHRFPHVDEIKKKIEATTRYMISMDLTASYHQVRIRKEDRHLTTFSLEQGLFQMKRACMGLASSGDEFCARSDKVFDGVKTVKLVDDVLLQEPSKKEALATFRKVLERCRANGVVLSASKLKAGTDIPFAGFRVKIVENEPTINPDPAKCKAFREMRRPENVAELRSFLGSAAQLAS